MRFIKGDIVRNPEGYDGEVSWVNPDTNKVGVIFDRAKSEGNVYNATDLTMVKKSLYSMRTKEPFAQLSLDERRQAIQDLRTARKESIINAHNKPKRKSSSKKSTSSSRKKKVKSKEEILANLGIDFGNLSIDVNAINAKIQSDNNA